MSQLKKIQRTPRKDNTKKTTGQCVAIPSLKKQGTNKKQQSRKDRETTDKRTKAKRDIKFPQTKHQQKPEGHLKRAERKNENTQPRTLHLVDSVLKNKDWMNSVLDLREGAEDTQWPSCTSKRVSFSSGDKIILNENLVSHQRIKATGVAGICRHRKKPTFFFFCFLFLSSMTIKTKVSNDAFCSTWWMWLDQGQQEPGVQDGENEITKPSGAYTVYQVILRVGIKILNRVM